MNRTGVVSSAASAVGAGNANPAGTFAQCCVTSSSTHTPMATHANTHAHATSTVKYEEYLQAPSDAWSSAATVATLLRRSGSLPRRRHPVAQSQQQQSECAVEQTMPSDVVTSLTSGALPGERDGAAAGRRGGRTYRKREQKPGGASSSCKAVSSASSSSSSTNKKCRNRSFVAASLFSFLPHFRDKSGGAGKMIASSAMSDKQTGEAVAEALNTRITTSSTNCVIVASHYHSLPPPTVLSAGDVIESVSHQAQPPPPLHPSLAGDVIIPAEHSKISANTLEFWLAPRLEKHNAEMRRKDRQSLRSAHSLGVLHHPENHQHSTHTLGQQHTQLLRHLHHHCAEETENARRICLSSFAPIRKSALSLAAAITSSVTSEKYEDFAMSPPPPPPPLPPKHVAQQRMTKSLTSLMLSNSEDQHHEQQRNVCDTQPQLLHQHHHQHPNTRYELPHNPLHHRHSGSHLLHTHTHSQLRYDAHNDATGGGRGTTTSAIPSSWIYTAPAIGAESATSSIPAAAAPLIQLRHLVKSNEFLFNATTNNEEDDEDTALSSPDFPKPPPPLLLLHHHNGTVDEIQHKKGRSSKLTQHLEKSGKVYFPASSTPPPPPLPPPPLHPRKVKQHRIMLSATSDESGGDSSTTKSVRKTVATPSSPLDTITPPPRFASNLQHDKQLDHPASQTHSMGTHWMTQLTQKQHQPQRTLIQNELQQQRPRMRRSLTCHINARDADSALMNIANATTKTGLSTGEDSSGSHGILKRSKPLSKSFRKCKSEFVTGSLLCASDAANQLKLSKQHTPHIQSHMAHTYTSGMFITPAKNLNPVKQTYTSDVSAPYHSTATYAIASGSGYVQNTSSSSSTSSSVSISTHQRHQADLYQTLAFLPCAPQQDRKTCPHQNLQLDPQHQKHHFYVGRSNATNVITMEKYQHGINSASSSSSTTQSTKNQISMKNSVAAALANSQRISKDSVALLGQLSVATNFEAKSYSLNSLV